MGKKRNRSTANAKPATDMFSGDGRRHTQTLVDEVREAREVEFAAERRHEKRAKRRKVNEEVEEAALKKAGRALRKEMMRGGDGVGIGGVRRVDARKAGLEMWRRAALRRRGRRGKGEGEGEEEVVDAKTTAKIFKEAKDQRAEIREENLRESASEAARISARVDQDLRGVGRGKGETDGGLDDSDVDSEEEVESGHVVGEDELGGEDFEFLDATKITEEDEMALAMFSNMEIKAGEQSQGGVDGGAGQDGMGGAPRIMLADIILAKIREKDEADARAAEIAADPEKAARDRKIAEVYGLVGNILAKYRSGKVPKAFKVIPKLKNWEEILYLTRPDEWSPAAVYVATRLLASNLPAKEVVRFYRDVLLPRCMEDIGEHKKLNYHLYRALEKAVYKPEAFNKGILFEMCEDVSCTLRQATIIASVVKKVSMPMLHSAAALMYIAGLPYRPPNSLIVTALIDKRYALPYRVIDAVVESFMEMKSDRRAPPLIWHQSLLAFAQRYKTEITVEQKERLKVLMRVHGHHAVTPEIRRELFSTRNRGDVNKPDANTIAKNMQSAAMMV